MFSLCISLLVVFMASLKITKSDYQAVNIIKCKYRLPLFKVEALYHWYTLAFGNLHCPMGQDIQIQLEITPLYFPQVNQRINRNNTSSISTEKSSMVMSIRKDSKINSGFYMGKKNHTPAKHIHHCIVIIWIKDRMLVKSLHITRFTWNLF